MIQIFRKYVMGILHQRLSDDSVSSKEPIIRGSRSVTPYSSLIALEKFKSTLMVSQTTIPYRTVPKMYSSSTQPDRLSLLDQGSVSMDGQLHLGVDKSPRTLLFLLLDANYSVKMM